MNPKRYLPAILILAIAAFFAINRLYPGKTSHPSGRDMPQVPMTKDAGQDHNNPENQRRMAIFHYNEGNKFLRQENWSEAVRNYEMSLRHNQDIPDIHINLSTAQLRARTFDKAYETLKTLQEKNPNHPALFYNLACYYALTSQIDPAWESLQNAVTLGFKNIAAIKTDPDLAPLRNDPRYAEWIKNR